MKLKINRQMLTIMLVLALGVLAMGTLQPMVPLYLSSIGVVPQTVGLMLFVVLNGIGTATFSPAALGMVSDLVPRNRQSTAMGIYGAFGENTGIIAGASLGGFIWSAWGPQYAFLTGSVTSALGLLICLLLLKDSSRQKL